MTERRLTLQRMLSQREFDATRGYPGEDVVSQFGEYYPAISLWPRGCSGFVTVSDLFRGCSWPTVILTTFLSLWLTTLTLRPATDKWQSKWCIFSQTAEFLSFVVSVFCQWLLWIRGRPGFTCGCRWLCVLVTWLLWPRDCSDFVTDLSAWLCGHSGPWVCVHIFFSSPFSFPTLYVLCPKHV